MSENESYGASHSEGEENEWNESLEAENGSEVSSGLSYQRMGM